MVKKIGEMLSGIEAVQLTDYTATNYKGVMDATMQGYNSAMQALQSKVSVDGANYSQQVQRASQEEAQRVAMLNAQGKGSGGNTAQGLVELGSSLVAGYIGMEELSERKKQVEFQKKIQLEDQQFKREDQAMQRETFQMQKEAAAEEARIGKLMGTVEGFIANTDGMISEVIANEGADKGIAVAKQLVKEFMSNPDFDALAPQDRLFISSKLHANLAKLQKENIDRIHGEKEGLLDAQVQSATDFFNTNNVTTIKAISSGLLPDTDINATINTLMSNATSLLTQGEFAGVRSSPEKLMQYQSNVLQQINAALTERYGEAANADADAARFMGASDQVAALERMMLAGELSSYDYQRLSKKVLLENQITIDPSQLPTSAVSLRQEQIKNDEQLQQLTTIQQREAALNPMWNSPEMQAAQRYSIGVNLWNSVNGRGLGIEGRKAQLQELKRLNPAAYGAELGDAQVELLNDFETDRTALNNLNQQSLDLEKQLLELDFKVNPPKFKEFILNANQPLGALQGKTPEPENRIIPANERVPQANAELAVPLREKLRELDRQRQDLYFKYASYGVNLADPKDQSFQIKLEQETAAARQAAAEKARQEGVNPNTTSSSITPSSTGAQGSPKYQTPISSSNFSQADQEILRRASLGYPSSIPKNEAPSTPSLPLSGNLAKTPHGFVPFKGGTITFTTDFNRKARVGSVQNRDHNGIDIVSTDPRIATMQGGTVEGVFTTAQSGGYGNTVMVRTPDGRVEMFAHLQDGQIPVRKGDKIAPGTVIGLMGNTGRSRGAHLHFEVWKAGTDISTWGKGRQEDPLAYLGMLSVKRPTPRGSGNTPSGRPSATLQDGSTSQTYNTGVVRLGGNLVYTNGYILDKSNGAFRKATPADQELIEKGTPVTKTVTTGYTGTSISTGTRSTSSGASIVEDWRIPAKAQQEGTYMFVHPSGRKTADGNDVLTIRGFYQGKQLFAVEALSGTTGLAGNRELHGQNGMIQDGEYRIEGDGKLIPTFQTQRANLAIQNGGVNGTGISVRLPKDYQKVLHFLRKQKPRMYVNTTDKLEQVATPSTVTTLTGRPQENYTGSLSVHKSAYGKNSPTANYGYKQLRDNPGLASALASAADSLGIPAVWLADLIQSESGWRHDVDNGVGYAGLIQFGDAAAKDAAKELGYKDWRNWTRHHIIRLPAAVQLAKFVPAYLKVTERYAGKKIETLEDLTAAVWGGNGLLKKSPQERARRNIGDGWVDWKGKLNQLIRSNPAGRSYMWLHDQLRSNNTTHTNPRGGCASCNNMLASGNFIPHKRDANNWSNMA